MASFVLIHGAWQGAWCWREVIPRLESRGHRTLAIDLPGHGSDPTPPEAATLHGYVDAVIHAITPLDERLIVVGHSMGGVISQVAEAVPGRIRALVYVAALLPPNGTPMLQVVDGLDPQYLAQFVWAQDRRTARIRPEGAAEFLYQLCPPALVEDAVARLTAEPVAPFETPIQTTPENYGRVPRYYIECLRDRVIPIALQKAMYSSVPCKRVYSIDSDHSPFFSAPEELAAVLHSIGAES